MIRMRATKPLTYRTRRLLADGTTQVTSSLNPGDVFEVMKPRDVRVLKATRKAEELRPAVDVPPPPADVAKKIAASTATPADPASPAAPDPASDLAAVRAEYESVVGKKPFHAWSAEQLRAKIAEHQAGS